MMKALMLLTLMLLVLQPGVTMGADSLTPDRIRVCGKEYSVVHRATDPADGSSISEYAPPGSTATSWTRLVTIHSRPQTESPEEYIQKVAEIYSQKNPGMKFSSGGDPSKGDHWMDAIFVGAPDKASPTANTVEWSFFKASPSVSGPRVLQYSERRRYKESPEEIYKTWDLSSLRNKLLPRLLSARIP